MTNDTLPMHEGTNTSGSRYINVTTEEGVRLVTLLLNDDRTVKQVLSCHVLRKLLAALDLDRSDKELIRRALLREKLRVDKVLQKAKVKQDPQLAGLAMEAGSIEMLLEKFPTQHPQPVAAK